MKVAARSRHTDAEQRRWRRKMREIVHIQAGQCGNQIGTKVSAVPVCKNVDLWKR